MMDLSPDPRHPDKPMKARGWTRSIRSIGGYWQGEFTLNGRTQDLTNFFYNNMACHLEEWSRGYKTWEGMIYDMELLTQAGSRRRSLDDMYNSVRGRYRDTNGDRQLTDAATNDTSILLYGTRQLYWPLAGQDLTVAEETRDKILAEAAFPWARPLNRRPGRNEPSSLTVRACGYVFTANWQIETASNDTQDELSDWIILIIQANCPLLKVGDIRRNVFQVNKSNENDMRGWDQITKLLEIGFDTQPARCYVDNDRYVYYNQIGTTPSYFARGGKLYGTPGSQLEVNPWQLKPGVVRDSEFPLSKAEPGSWLSDNRDWYMSEITVGDNGDGTYRIDPKSQDYEESDILTSIEQFKEQFKRWKEEKRQKRHAK